MVITRKLNGCTKAIGFMKNLQPFIVTVSDLIGDVDPIKAASLKLSYADERVIHFGMIPRATDVFFCYK